MSDPNQSTIGELIKAFYEEKRGPGYLDEVKVIKGWNGVVGPFIAQYTKDLFIKDGVLLVRLTSDSLRTELGYSKSLLLKNLNQLVGYELLKDIVFK
jgi:predicted nucleic acid-binding Zn ribbon protein